MLRLWCAPKKAEMFLKIGRRRTGQNPALTGVKPDGRVYAIKKVGDPASMTFSYARAAVSAQGFSAKEGHKAGRYQPGKAVYKPYTVKNITHKNRFPNGGKNKVREEKRTVLPENTAGPVRRISSGLLSRLPAGRRIPEPMPQ